MGSKWVTYFWIAEISFHSTRVVTVSLCSSTCAFSVKICLRKYIMAATWWVWNWKLGVHFICLHISLWYSLWVSHWEFDSQWQQISSSAVVCLVMCTARWFKHDWQRVKANPLLSSLNFEEKNWTIKIQKSEISMREMCANELCLLFRFTFMPWNLYLLFLHTLWRLVSFLLNFKCYSGISNITATNGEIGQETNYSCLVCTF